MAIRIPEEKVAEIRHAVDIVDLISESVLLKKTGKNFAGLCPFHAEKTPSFTVSPDKQIFHCFGCGTGGNVFSFVMKRDGLAFGEAARLLARRGGVDLPERRLSPLEQRQAGERERLFEVNRMALDFFRNALAKHPEGHRALAYLEGRGLTRQTIDHFLLGYAPKGWDNLLNALGRKRVGPQLLSQAGLVVARKEGSGFYDRFRERIIFPILDETSRVVAFGGRVLDDSTPKYLNSPETPIYQKRRTLYGLHRAKEFCRAAGSAYIVEGYLDLIALHAHGIENAVATLGTALTAEHLQTLGRFAEKMVLVYDSDEAGIRSAHRCVELFWKEHVDFRRGDVFREEQADTHILVLPAGHDPDSFLAGHGADQFRSLAQSAPGIVTFLLEAAVARHGLATEGKIRIVAELLEPLAAINDTVARALYVKQLAERLQLPERIILERLGAHAGRSGQRPADAAPGAPDRPARRLRAQAGGHEPFERRIVSMMLQFPEVIAEITERGILSHFGDSVLRSIGELLVQQGYRACDQLPELLRQISDEGLRQRVVSLAMGEASWSPKGCRILLNRYLELRQQHRVSLPLQKEIEAAEKANDADEALRLLGEKHKLALKREKRKTAARREK